MRPEEITKLKDRIRAARVKLLASVNDLNEAAWDWRPEDDRWSVRLTLAHVGSAQWDHLDVLNRLLSGEPTAMSDFDLDAWNAASVARRDDWVPARILADLEAAQQETMAFLDRLDDGQLVVTGTHPALGRISVAQVLRIIALHDGLHRRDVLQLLREMDEHETSR